jgi:lipopolysaccharide/colanic/teichoic acid biosynthesis glycosyltransferase
MRQDKFAEQMLPRGSAPPSSPSRRYERLGQDSLHGLVKAFFDRTVAAVAILLLAPVLLVVALCVAATSPGPVLVRRARVGRNGQLFSLLGFRVTEVDAVGRGARSASKDQGSGWPAGGPERAETRLGVILRRYSIDELPQLINVLKGDMSLVGPRPGSPSEVARFGVDVRRRFPVKPGLTGLGRTSSPERFADDRRPVDVDHVENWSLLRDLGILRRTFAAALRGKGAP